MTPDEYRQKLEALSDQEFDEFQNKFGGGNSNREIRVRQYAYDRQHEPQICYLLGLETEEDKRTEAAVTSANAAEESAKAAREAEQTARSSRNIAFVALLIATVMAVVGIMTYFRDRGLG